MTIVPANQETKRNSNLRRTSKADQAPPHPDHGRRILSARNQVSPKPREPELSLRDVRILQPESGIVIEGTVVRSNIRHFGSTFMIIAGNRNCAIETEAHVHPGGLVRIVPITLDASARGPRLAWDVYRRNHEDNWTPVEGQHLEDQTKLGLDWLNEVEPQLKHLKVQTEELKQKLHTLERERTGINPRSTPKLERPQALALARSQVLGPRWQSSLDSFLRIHQTVKEVRNDLRRLESMRVTSRWTTRWWRFWLFQRPKLASQERALREKLATARTHRLSAFESLREFRRATAQPSCRQEIERLANDFIARDESLRRKVHDTASALLDHEIKLSEATSLAFRLGRIPNEPVTMKCSAVSERRKLSLPKPVEAFTLNPAQRHLSKQSIH